MKPQIFLRPRTLVAVGSWVASVAWAHPGHEHPVTPPDSAAHWFVEPEHLLGWVGVALAVAAIYKSRSLWLRGSSKVSPVFKKTR